MRRVFFCLIFLFVAGCASQQKARQLSESDLKSVVGALSGQDLDNETLEKLNRDFQHNPAAQSSVQTIQDAFRPEDARIKYCPLTGERYSPELTMCPVHGVRLELVK